MRRRLNITRLRWDRDRPEEAPKILPGDACPSIGCVGHIVIYTTRPSQGGTTRYMQCNTCKFKPDSKLVE